MPTLNVFWLLVSKLQKSFYPSIHMLSAWSIIAEAKRETAGTEGEPLFLRKDIVL